MFGTGYRFRWLEMREEPSAVVSSEASAAQGQGGDSDFEEQGIRTQSHASNETDDDGIDTHDLLAHHQDDDAPPLVPSALAAWLRRWRCPAIVIDVLILGLLQDVKRYIELDAGLLGKLCLFFSIFSARLLFIPLWTAPFVPALSPIYEHGPVS